MNVSDAFLLTVAEVSAGLIGLFLVGMVFYVQTGFRRLERSRSVVEPYFRASTRIVLIVYTVPLGVSLVLVALPLGWAQVTFWTLILGLVAANVSTIGGVRPVMKATGSRLLLYNEVVGTIGVAAMIIVTLANGGVAPDRHDLTPAILLGLGLGFLSTCVLVLTLFDIAEFEREQPHREPGTSLFSRLRTRRQTTAPRDDDATDSEGPDRGSSVPDREELDPTASTE